MILQIKHRIPLIEKWLALPKMYHWGFFVCCLSAVNFATIFEGWYTYQKGQTLEQEASRQAMELAHQEKLLSTLKQHSDSRELSPQLTKQIVILDEQIHSLLNDETELVSYQWDFSSQPVLQIQLAGRFQDLYHFLTALLAQGSLSFVQLAIEKTESGALQSHLILQLKRGE
ncbi:hypothetical protein [Rodentibacter trehalosifermentans]|uniref:Competence protein C n=1 Tax=Rodentibacter trehalosifermentans TaxID=1908263 RepID=A0A1V3IQ99_9PAST|nr:hypothetical protein [Rodentibacter trehalosifermentans]OOF44291.1 hypothetical protein BKK51_09310 [Rodentibacter trehalosifermentans]OOF47404.1 hypothetical protein BKK52_09360 [Rodentibacter trehalosifermentans]OOF52202.1 hypothetical protein BKK53_06655 [Rodentibacter trehalosifermentans]